MADQVIDNPTYFGHVRHFFEDIDLAHMHQVGIDISNFESLKARSIDVYFQTRPPNAAMPPEAARKWSQERSDTFFNWIENGHPLGQATPQPVVPVAADRIRKDARDLTTAELDKLTLAFEGLMGLPTDNPDSYFALAGMHWFPEPTYCKHHEDRYNPWHRAYLARFEDALRTVPGCADVTLPYWDITGPLPDFLSNAPFDSYTLPERVHANYDAGYTTERFDAATIAANVQAEVLPGINIPAIIDNAMSQSVWGDFVTFTGLGIEAAHDFGHGACGTTISNPDLAAFDPLFWFFHSNWDRLWWRWQQAMSATTLWSFRSTILGSTDFLRAPFNELGPFAMTADQTIDSAAMGIAYADPSGPPPSPLDVASAAFGSRLAAGGMRVRPTPMASVRLKGLDRLAIPGSFRAILHQDDQPLGHRVFFQSTQPAGCANCRRQAKVDLDFIVPIDDILGRRLSVTIEVLTPDAQIGPRIPLSACGDPTINVRLLLNE